LPLLCALAREASAELEQDYSIHFLMHIVAIQVCPIFVLGGWLTLGSGYKLQF